MMAGLIGTALVLTLGLGGMLLLEEKRKQTEAENSL